MITTEINTELKNENTKLKLEIQELQKELINIKEKLDKYKLSSKKYYETHKEEIKQKVKTYNIKNNYKPNITIEKKQEYNKIAYQKRKEKLESLNI